MVGASFCRLHFIVAARQVLKQPLQACLRNTVQQLSRTQQDRGLGEEIKVPGHLLVLHRHSRSAAHWVGLFHC